MLSDDVIPSFPIIGINSLTSRVIHPKTCEFSDQTSRISQIITVCQSLIQIDKQRVLFFGPIKTRFPQNKSV